MNKDILKKAVEKCYSEKAKLFAIKIEVCGKENEYQYQVWQTENISEQELILYFDRHYTYHDLQNFGVITTKIVSYFYSDEIEPIREHFIKDLNKEVI